MTDPMDAPAADPASPDTPIAAGPVSGWVSPDGKAGGRGAQRGCCLVVALVLGVMGAMSVVSLAFVFFLDSQASSSLAGTIEFEASDVTGCYVRQPATTFPSSATIHTAAHFSRDVQAQERVTVVATFPDGTEQSTDTFYDEAGDCVSDIIPPGLEQGAWAFEFRVGAEILATGGFVITP